MSNEIKEILDDLLFTTTLPNVSIKLNKEKLNQLKDYITNLQQENEKLKEENERLKELDENYPIEEELAEAYRREEDYKSRIEKAVEYIKENAWYMNKDDEEILDRIGVEGLLKILEGDNNE